MADREALYLRLPIWAQNLATSLEGWRIQRRRYSGDYATVLASSCLRLTWSDEEFRAYRDRRIREFVAHAYESVPFYRDRFDAAGVHPAEVLGLDDLQLLPLLTKPEVQDAGSSLVSDAVPPRQRVNAHTSGTTGGGLRFATTKQAQREQWAVWWRYFMRHGVAPQTWCGYFGGRSVVPLSQTEPPFWRIDRPGRRILMSAYHMSEETMDAYVDILRERQPPWLHGYPSLLALLAQHVLRRGRALEYPVQWITAGAENLLTHQAQAIAAAFGVEPVQHYGMAEAAANASQCPAGNLHIDEDFAGVELLSEPGSEGHKIVGTNFSNLAAPLIRYEIGDVAGQLLDSCGCRLPGRAIRRIDGRAEDYVILRNGAKLGRLDHVFKDLVNIREAQILQRQPGAAIFRIVRGPAYTEADEQMLLDEARKRLGSEFEITVDYVETIHRSSRGKLRFVVSDLPEGSIGPQSSKTLS